MVKTREGIKFSSETPLEHEPEIFTAVPCAYRDLVGLHADGFYSLKSEFKTVSQVRCASDSSGSIQIRIRRLGKDEWQKVLESTQDPSPEWQNVVQDAQDPTLRQDQVPKDAQDIKLWINVLKEVAEEATTIKFPFTPVQSNQRRSVEIQIHQSPSSGGYAADYLFRGAAKEYKYIEDGRPHREIVEGGVGRLELEELRDKAKHGILITFAQQPRKVEERSPNRQSSDAHWKLNFRDNWR